MGSTSLLQAFPDKSRSITVQALMNDGEAMAFAKEIREFFQVQGYDVKALQLIANLDLTRLSADPVAYAVRVGSRFARQ